jgi:MraZ protein
MEVSQNNRALSFNSTYRHELDDKRRLQIPYRWRERLEGQDLTVVLWPKHRAGACLRVYLPEQMAKLEATVNALANSDENKGVLRRLIGANSVHVAMDKAGRITLPDELARKADVMEKAVLVGALDWVEIWSAERYQQVEAGDEALAQRAFSQME